MALHDDLALKARHDAGGSCGVAEDRERQAPHHMLEDVLARPIVRGILRAIARPSLGRCHCAIQQDGDVSPCVYISFIQAGSLRQQSFEEIWDRSLSWSALRWHRPPQSLWDLRRPGIFRRLPHPLAGLFGRYQSRGLGPRDARETRTCGTE